jgi:16S rRNA C1402 N4-methylase RsmH
VGRAREKNVLRSPKRLTDLLPSGVNCDDGRSALELLAATPNERLEEVIARLKKTRPAEEICDAIIKLIALAPLSEFLTLREIYRRHCDSACK